MKMTITKCTGLFAALLTMAQACGTHSVSSESVPTSASNSSEEINVRWREPIEVAVGGGHRGPWRMNRSEWDFVDDATVAINDAGFIGVAWAYHEKQDVLFQLYSPDGTKRFDEPVNVSRSSSIFSWLPRMILTDADDAAEITVYLLWQEIVFSGGSHGGEIFFSRSTDGGGTFSEPINLSNTTAGAGKGRLNARRWHNGSYDMVIAPNGDLHVAWTEYEGNLWFSRSTDGGRSFTEPMHIAGGDDRGEPPARGPSLAVDKHNRLYLAWTVGETADANIQLAVSDDGGESFTSPRAVHDRDGHADAPKLAVDGKRRVHLAYMESPAGPFQRYHVRYARADRGDLDFTEPREISGGQPGRFASIGFPTLQLDGEDNLHLTWELYQQPHGRPIALGFTRSTDGGETFATPMLVPGAHGREDRATGGAFSGSQQGLLMSKLAVNRRGSFAIVNSAFQPNRGSSIWLVRGEVDSASPGNVDDE